MCYKKYNDFPVVVRNAMLKGIAMIAIAVLLSVPAISGYAEDGWKFVTMARISNAYFEVNKAGIESVGTSEVRALTRFTRIDPARNIRGLAPDIAVSEMSIIFDCSQKKYRMHQVTHITVSGNRIPAEASRDTHKFEDIPEGTMFEIMHSFVCRAAGKS